MKSKKADVENPGKKFKELSKALERIVKNVQQFEEKEKAKPFNHIN